MEAVIAIIIMYIGLKMFGFKMADWIDEDHTGHGP